MLRVVSVREHGTWVLKPHRGERENLIESAFLSFSTSALPKLDLKSSLFVKLPPARQSRRKQIWETLEMA